MPDISHVAILFAVGLAAGGINVMAGGGSTLTLPTLIFLGLDTTTANGTNRVAILIQNIFAVWSFRRRNMSRLRQSLMLAVFTLPGGVIGALVAAQVNDTWFKRILGVIMIGVVISMIIPRKRRETSPDGIYSFWAYPALFGIGFYGGFIQVGVGFLIMATLYHLLRMDLIFVNMHKVLIVLVFNVPALAVFALLGHVDWALGLALAAGNSTGAWWAARWSVEKGERLIRVVLILAVVLMAFKLLGAF